MGQSVGRYDLNSTGEVGEFIERLALLAPSAWIAASSPSKDHAVEVSAQNLESLIAGTGRQLEAWSVADAVETTAHIAFGSTAADKRFLSKKASAIRTATSAALGIRFRSELSPEDFERLYRPFSKLIPFADLARPESPSARSS
jgi:hypothetical protein